MFIIIIAISQLYVSVGVLNRYLDMCHSFLLKGTLIQNSSNEPLVFFFFANVQIIKKNLVNKYINSSTFPVFGGCRNVYFMEVQKYETFCVCMFYLSSDMKKSH